MYPFYKVFSLVFLFTLILTILTPTSGLPMRQSSHGDSPGKEVNHGDHGSTRDESSHRKDHLKRGRDSDSDLRSTKIHRSSPDRANVEESAKKQKVLEKQDSGIRRTAQKAIETSVKEIKRLHREYNQYWIAAEEARKAGVSKGNTNLEPWVEKYIERKNLLYNVGRHEKTGNYLSHTPAVQQALHERADKLKVKPYQLEKEMAKLKSEGTYDRALLGTHISQENQKRDELIKMRNKHHDHIYRNEKVLREYEKN